MTTHKTQRPWSSAAKRMLRSVQGIFFDVDDTFSSDGKITDTAYSALWRARRAGLILVPITGRPAGWADHIARMWPVDGVVAENGAMATYLRDGKLRTDYLLDSKTRAQNRKRLQRLQQTILKAVPGAGVASDQQFRLFDLAIDYCEDVAPLPPSQVQQIVDLFVQAGATAKVSSIHVNGWFGDYSKIGMCQRFAKRILHIDLDKQRQRYLFIGDSPNDAPMFEYFPNSIGVANFRQFADQVDTPPRFITQGQSGRGFAQVVQAVLEQKRSA